VACVVLERAGGGARPTHLQPDADREPAIRRRKSPMNPPSTRPFKILHLEDVATDAELIERTLRRSNARFEVLRAGDRRSFEAALDSYAPDVVLSAYRLPDLTGLDALKIAQAHDPDLPVIVVTGALGDEAAAELIVAGARDYVLKDRLARLPIAVERVLVEAAQERSRSKAEAALALQAANVSAVLETSLDGILAVDVDGRAVLHNRRFEEIFRFSPDDMATRDDQALLQGAVKLMVEPERFLESVRRLYSQPDATSIDELQLKDGRTFDRYSSPVHLPGGAYVGRVWFFRDITARKQSEQAIRDSEARFRGLVEQEIAGIYIIAADGRIDYINPRFAHMFGYEPQEVIGKPFVDFVVERDRQALLQRLAAEVANKASPAMVATALRKKDGTLVDVVGHSRPATYDGRPVSIGVLLDVTDQKKGEIALRRLNRALATLSETNSAIVRASSEADLMNAICRIIVDRGGYRMAWLGIAQNDPERNVTPVAVAGDDQGYLKSVRVTWAEDDPYGAGVTGTAARTGLPQTSQNLATDQRMKPWQATATKHGFAASAAFPLKYDGRVLAILSLYSGDVDAFNADERKLLQELADDTAYGIQALRTRVAHEVMIQRWRTSLVDTIRAISSTSELRDPYTAGHQRRVAELATALARELRLPEEQVHGIYLAALIHDVGKVTVPGDLLTKPGKLTPLEYQLIQTHAQAGYEVVKGIDFPWPIAQALLQHHERLDGSGYPNGLRGDEIIQDARILAVADVVEAMMSHRPYRPALGIDAALAEIEKNKGILFDAAAVDACIRLFRSREFHFQGPNV
jgi:PAS domain S-box-containing protein